MDGTNGPGQGGVWAPPPSASRSSWKAASGRSRPAAGFGSFCRVGWFRSRINLFVHRPDHPSPIRHSPCTRRRQGKRPSATSSSPIRAAVVTSRCIERVGFYNPSRPRKACAFRWTGSATGRSAARSSVGHRREPLVKRGDSADPRRRRLPRRPDVPAERLRRHRRDGARAALRREGAGQGPAVERRAETLLSHAQWWLRPPASATVAAGGPAGGAAARRTR